MVYRKVGRVLPRRLVGAFKQQFDYLGISLEETRFVGFLVLFFAALSAGIALNVFFWAGIHPAVTFAGLFSLFVGGTYFWLSLSAESKGRYVERVLPDALQLIASNVRSGLTTERALLVSARPEFGPLEGELRRAAKRILTGVPVEDALAGMTKNIRSRTFSQTIWLINKGISSGGQVADILQQLSTDLQGQNALQEEVRANVSIYVLLIFFAAAIGAPLMLGISSFIVQVLDKQLGAIDVAGVEGASTQLSGAQGFMITGGGEGINPDFVVLFSELALLSTLFFAALTIGIINTGYEKNGIKFFPILLLVGFGLFFAIRFGLGAVFASLL